VVHRISVSLTRFAAWLGVGRAQFLFALFGGTGLASLILNAVRPAPAWVAPLQSLLAAGALVGAALIIVTNYPSAERRQALYVIVPAVGALVVALLIPSLSVVMVVLAVGWLVIAAVTLRSQVRQEYQAAIKLLRKGEYEEAIKVMTGLIKAEGAAADHYRFRAELYRLTGKVKKARTDYERVIALTPDSGVGYNGVAELLLQVGNYSEALTFAHEALSREPNQWVAAYNTGMIEDRLGMWREAEHHLQQALDAVIPDSRHRLLAHFWMLRARLQQDDREGVEKALLKLKAERAGLREWQTIFESADAAILRDVLAVDVELAGGLAEGKLSPDALKETEGSTGGN